MGTIPIQQVGTHIACLLEYPFPDIEETAKRFEFDYIVVEKREVSSFEERSPQLARGLHLKDYPLAFSNDYFSVHRPETVLDP